MGGAHHLLQVGQTVNLDDQASGLQVTVLTADQPGKKVTQVGIDYVVFDDESAGIATRVPFHLIKSVSAPAPVVEQPLVEQPLVEQPLVEQPQAA